MNSKNHNLSDGENQKNHQAYTSANVRKTLDTTADIDRIDLEILRLLQNNARISNKEIAAATRLALRC
jgi:hypothetical protein